MTANDWTGAACEGAYPEMFFDPSATAVADAKAICVDCPIRLKCLEYALNPANGINSGVWGGLTQDERKVITGRNRSRSRKGIPNRKH